MDFKKIIADYSDNVIDERLIVNFPRVIWLWPVSDMRRCAPIVL